MFHGAGAFDNSCKPLNETPNRSICVYVPWGRVIWNQWVASSAHPRKTRCCPFGTTPRPVGKSTILHVFLGQAGGRSAPPKVA